MQKIENDLIEDSNNFIIDLKLFEGIGNKLTFVNIEKTKDTFLETVKSVGSRYTNYLPEFDRMLINIDRKLDIFIKRLSRSQIFQLLINENDKNFLHIEFMPSSNIGNSFYILNKNDEIVLMIDYDFISLLKNSKFLLDDILITFLRIDELRDYQNLHFNHKINFFENKICSDQNIIKKSENQLNSINKMKRNLNIHIYIATETLHYSTLKQNNLIMNYRLLTRYMYGAGKGYSYLPFTEYITTDLNHFYKYMDLFWERKNVQNPNLVISNARIINKYLKRNTIVDSYIFLQPKEITTVAFDSARLYFYDNKFFIKITDKMNLSLLGDEYIYMVGIEHQQLYKLNDFLVNRDAVLLVFNMMTI